jgi:hypothetical protein
VKNSFVLFDYACSLQSSAPLQTYIPLFLPLAQHFDTIEILFLFLPTFNFGPIAAKYIPEDPSNLFP